MENTTSRKPLSLADIEQWLDQLGAKMPHKRRLYRAWLNRAEWPSTEDESFPKSVRAALGELRSVLEGIATIASRHPGSDPESERLLVTLADGQTVESVLLPRQGVCVSTQLGCAVGCRFCMTGRSGLIRQLSDAEIVAQVARARALHGTTKKVVFMGMGEPSHNLDAVFGALLFLADYGDFGHKDLVVSTVGDERLFERLHASRVKPALAVSLHTIEEEKRRHLLPRGTRMSVENLIAAAERWACTCHYPTQYQWTVMEGANDSPEEARELAEKLKGHYAMVNFIPVNTVSDSPYRRGSRESLATLVRVCREAGVIATLRDSAAQDVDGGCGQLRARVLLKKESRV